MELISLKLAIVGIATITNLVLLLVVFKQNPRSTTNKSFAVFSASVTLWMIAAHLSTTPATNLFWARMTIFFAAALSACFFVFAHTFPRTTLQLSKLRRIVTALITAFIMALTISPFTFVAVTDGPVGPQLVVGPGMPVFGVFVFFLSFSTVYIFWRKMRTFSGAMSIQVSFVFTGALLMLSLILGTVMLPVLLFQNDSFVQFMPLYTLIFLGMTAYAIIRHRLFDIRLLLARTISFLMLISIGAATYAFVLIFGIQRLFGVQIPWLVLLSAWGLTIVAMLTFRPLERWIRQGTNRFFFKGEYESDKLMSALTHAMAETIDLDEMTGRILGLLTREMRIGKAAFIIIGDHAADDIKAIGYQSNDFEESSLDTLFHQYATTIYHFIFEDLPESEMKDLFRKLDISYALPIRVETTEVAILVLGPKLSGDVYSQKDIDLVDIFASQAGIAIQNAKSFTEIKKFSQELEQRVIDRTHELQESQQRELEKAKDVARLKDEFVFVAAHELRTPVAVIKGFLELVSEATQNFPKDVKENLLAISAASNQLNQLINDLLEIARSEAGATKIAVEATDVVSIIESTVKELTPIAARRNINLTIERRDPMARAMVDGKKIKEILNNLLSNAIKYNRDQGEVEVSIFMATQGLSRNLMVEIRDTGYGIPKDQQDKIFQKFFRAHAPGTQEVIGTGLGLFITRMLIEKMGGKIQFTSLEGQGTTFAVSLPSE